MLGLASMAGGGGGLSTSSSASSKSSASGGNVGDIAFGNKTFGGGVSSLTIGIVAAAAVALLFIWKR